MAIIKEISRLEKHFKEINLNKSVSGLEAERDVRDTILNDIGNLAKEVNETRRGFVLENGTKMSPHYISFGEALTARYGCTLSQFLGSLGVYQKEHNLLDLARVCGQDNLSKQGVEQLMIDMSQFNSSPVNTGTFPSDWRFIIPEVFAEAVRTGYLHAALHGSWIAGTQNMTTHKLTMPRIERGDGVPSKVAEGADIPVGSIKFGKKDVKIFKIGTGFQITDEMVNDSALDLVFLFLQDVGSDMSIGADVQAMKVLISGEQVDGSESAPVVGVQTTGALSTLDLRRLSSRMSRLKRPVTSAILSEEDTLLDLNAAQPQREEKHVDEYLGIKTDNWILPASQGLLLNKSQAMVKLQYRGMMTERRRNPRNQTEELFVSDSINFAIIKRDARIIYDKTLAFSSVGFPSYMDIDNRINVAFNEV
jgi:hypothetical protein